MVTIIQFIAILSCTIFTGAAIYINLVEHPARMRFATSVAAAFWAPSYRRATMMQASLAILSFLSGGMVWWLGAGSLWLIAAVVIGSVVPFTFLIIMPTNRQLLDPGRDQASNETRALLEQWARLHAVRSLLSLAASAIYLVALLRAV